MVVDIDPNSGFCFGVQRAISKVEELTSEKTQISCLGDLVHNSEEVQRLSRLGMHTVDIAKAASLQNTSVLIRTHGEPPETYSQLKANKNTIVDATCPVVLKLQQRVKKSYRKISEKNGQLVIYGKKGHAEVTGLNGQTGHQAIVISSTEDLKQLNFNRPIELYCQTTMSLDGFETIVTEIKQQAKSDVIIHDTICRQVSNRVPQLKKFASQYDVIVFVSGKESSNGKFLASVCQAVNSNTHVVAHVDELEGSWFDGANRVGICGATSTPQWLMEDVYTMIKHYQ